VSSRPFDTEADLCDALLSDSDVCQCIGRTKGLIYPLEFTYFNVHFLTVCCLARETADGCRQGHSIQKQIWKQTSGDPSGLTLLYRGIMLLYNFTTALIYTVLSVTMARIVARLLNIY